MTLDHYNERMKWVEKYTPAKGLNRVADQLFAFTTACMDTVCEIAKELGRGIRDFFMPRPTKQEHFTHQLQNLVKNTQGLCSEWEAKLQRQGSLDDEDMREYIEALSQSSMAKTIFVLYMATTRQDPDKPITIQGHRTTPRKLTEQ